MTSLFIPTIDGMSINDIIRQTEGSSIKVYALSTENTTFEGAETIRLHHSTRIGHSNFLQSIASKADTTYCAIFTRPTSIRLCYRCIERMERVADDTGALMVYSDHYSTSDGVRTNSPKIDYQEGSLRDDFEFGGLWLIRTDALKRFVASPQSNNLKFGALYALRLALSREGSIYHLREFLYEEVELDTRKSGEKQFDYVNPAQREVQIEMERICTEHLRLVGALIEPDEVSDVPKETTSFPVEASVIIPVRNRVRTIKDAIESALSQSTDFPFNVIIVDNHSTDGTGDIVKSISEEDTRIILIQPERTDLGIGGCWDLAIRNEHCGRYAVQLDSDDLYSSPNTLTRIVEAFRNENAAMVIGSYRMVNFSLETLPPGLIDHKEWTDTNGKNNALRINGLGAPRAFRTELLRKIGFPNTSYGEDYALGLTLSRCFRIARIYDELYLCRRWEGNSDASLSIESVNKNNAYKDSLRTIELRARRAMIENWNKPVSQSDVDRFFSEQLSIWKEVEKRFEELNTNIKVRSFEWNDISLQVQYNPCRISSTTAKVSKTEIKKRPCFLCETNRPEEQISWEVERHLQVLVNPYPILPRHLTIPTRRHKPQLVNTLLDDMLRLVSSLPDDVVFYNGARCGASAPDHAHLQAGSKDIIPLQRDWKNYENQLERIYPSTEQEQSDLEDIGYVNKLCGVYLLRHYACPAFVVLTDSSGDKTHLIRKVIEALPAEKGQTEPDINLLAWRQTSSRPEKEHIVCVVFPRRKHRPECYFAKGKDQLLISPGAVDMGGLIITPREEDYNRITARGVVNILREVTLSEQEIGQIVRKMSSTKKDRRNSSSAMSTQLKKEPNVTVGIMNGTEIHFELNGPYSAKGETLTGSQVVTYKDGAIQWKNNYYSELTFSPIEESSTFTLDDVTIGVNFHWERNERQTFCGTLRVIVDEEKLVVINEVPVETYLTSVISSEMSGTSSAELLRAHAVVSRSWLLRQMQRRMNAQDGSFFSFTRKDDEFIRWYDRQDHTLFDVCADDHCQRYQGITRASSPAVLEAIEVTRGKVLAYDDEICDARFSKCCGGISERYDTCWEDRDVPYLQAIRDNANDEPLPDLTDETQAEAWIRQSPDSFCNTSDMKLLTQVLNDYDQETPDFYRWKVTYTQQELSDLIRSKREEDFGDIIDLQPVQRGPSGRLLKLRIVGSKCSLVIGKELEIRRALSPSHLYSSAFVVDKGDVVNGIPQSFTLTGAGWGHGTGMCQIGAAVMSDKGYDYEHILHHYYKNASIKQIYK